MFTRPGNANPFMIIPTKLSNSPNQAEKNSPTLLMKPQGKPLGIPTPAFADSHLNWVNLWPTDQEQGWSSKYVWWSYRWHEIYIYICSWLGTIRSDVLMGYNRVTSWDNDFYIYIYILLVGALEHDFYFPFHIWNVVLPIDELIFFRG